MEITDQIQGLTGYILCRAVHLKHHFFLYLGCSKGLSSASAISNVPLEGWRWPWEEWWLSPSPLRVLQAHTTERQDCPGPQSGRNKLDHATPKATNPILKQNQRERRRKEKQLFWFLKKKKQTGSTWGFFFFFNFCGFSKSASHRHILSGSSKMQWLHLTQKHSVTIKEKCSLPLCRKLRDDPE